jgi:uncharacterized LabA/DUF88 family protein
MTKVRKITVLIDGGFFYKRLKKWTDINRDCPVAVADAANLICKRHVQKLIREARDTEQSEWLDHVYRLFYYDAAPYEKALHHPLKNMQINFRNTDQAKFRLDLFDEVRKKRKFALRLGILQDQGAWTPYDKHLKGLLKFWHRREYVRSVIEDPSKHNPEITAEVLRDIDHWMNLGEDDVHMPLRQKGVDMRIGLDISTMTLKKQVDTIILVTGDSDFIPAAKLARREGVEVILDSMWQSVDDGLREHVDGVIYGFDRPSAGNAQ